MTSDPPLRLAFLADPDSVHTRRWVAWFASHGHEVALLDASDGELSAALPPSVRLVRYRRSDAPSPFSLLADRRALRRTLAELRSQVLHAHYVRRYGWQAAISGFRPRVVSPWGSDILRVRPGALRTRWWNRMALREADLVTVSSDGMRAAAIAGGALADRIRLIHHGVDTQLFMAAAPDAGLAARLAVGDATVILAPRAIRPLYRQDVVVDAVARLVAAGRDVILVLSARNADPATLADVHERSGVGGIAERLRVLPDVSHEELPALLNLADVVVSVPETDSFAVTLLEAMACQRPLVVTRLPAVAPVMRALDPLLESLMVPVGDVAATAAALERALSLDPDASRDLGARLRAHVVQHADYDMNMARMERLYRQLAAGR